MGFLDPDRQVLANQRHIVVVVKRRKEAVVIDVAVPRDINKKEYKDLEKYQGLKEELERMWKVKAKVVPLAVTPKLEEWLEQTPGTTSELSRRARC